VSGPVFSASARYYDLLYQDKDYAGEADYVAGLIERFHPGAKTLLELGSGTGRHALHLARKGLSIQGVERSEEMLSRARAAAHAAFPAPVPGSPDKPEFMQGDIRTVRIERQFDAAVSLFHVISYQTTDDDLRAAFRTARAHLRPGGLFVFDVWYGPAVLTNPPAVRIKRVSDEAIEVTRRAEPVHRPDRHLVEISYQVCVRNRKDGTAHEIREVHLMRYLFAPELDRLLGEAGLTLLHSEEWLTGREPGSGIWGVCFVARNG